MNKTNRKQVSFKRKFVSGISIVFLMVSALVVLFPVSFETASGYTMPSGVHWFMDDLVANSSNAVTGGGGNYNVHEDINVPQNSTLEVDGGERLYFDLVTGLDVYGTLNVIGNDMVNATFTSNETLPSFGDWRGISFFQGSGGTIQHASFFYAETGLHIQNTSISTIYLCEFKANVWGVRLTNGYCNINASIFHDNGILIHPDPLYSVGGGIYGEANSYSFIDSSEFVSNIGGIRNKGSMMYINTNTFNLNYVYGIYIEEGDYFNQSSANIINNFIEGNYNFGIYASLHYNSYIMNNDISYNRIGIYIKSSSSGTPPGGGGTINTNSISFNSETGIHCEGRGWDPTGMALNIIGNDIWSNTNAGVYLSNFTVSMNNNNIWENYFGIYAQNSTATVTASIFSSNTDSVVANASWVKLTNCQISSSVLRDFFLNQNANVTTLNTTFNHFAVLFADMLSKLTVMWYLHILVVNGSGPVASADAIVSDNDNGTWMGYYFTDSSGWVHWVEVVQYVRTYSTWVYYTPHNITASKDAEVGYLEPDMDRSRFVIVTIADGVMPPLPPTNLDIELLGFDLRLTWDASGDDGAGDDDVVSYEIYRAESVLGPYVFADNVSADNSPSYSWIDPGKGTGDLINYFYIVKAKDMGGLEDDNQNIVGKFVSSFADGWNMISVPLIQKDTTREVVLGTIDGNYEAVQGYHAGKSRPWLNWHRDKPHYFNDVVEITHTQGYFLDMDTPDYLITVGRVAATEYINLKTGWNLVGFPFLSDKTVDDALSSIAGKYNKVERYDTTLDKEIRLDPSDIMQPGLGYWIHATEDCVWTVTN